MSIITTTTYINEVINKSITRLTLVENEIVFYEKIGNFERVKELENKAVSIKAWIDVLNQSTHTLTEKQKEDLVQELQKTADLFNITSTYDYTNCGGLNLVAPDACCADEDIATLTTLINNHINNENNPHTVTINMISPLTTKGDIMVHNGTISTRFPAGTNGQKLVVNSATSTGLQWVNDSADRRELQNNTVPLVDRDYVNFLGGLTAVDTGSVINVSLSQIPLLSVLTNNTTGTGYPDDAVGFGADHYVLKRLGTTLTTGLIETDNIANDAVSFGKIQEIQANALVGTPFSSQQNMTSIPVNVNSVIGRLSGNITNISILDEDDLSSNSDQAIATQQSIKTYIDNLASSIYTSRNGISQDGTQFYLGGTLTESTIISGDSNPFTLTDLSTFATTANSDVNITSLGGNISLSTLTSGSINLSSGGGVTISSSGNWLFSVSSGRATITDTTGNNYGLTYPNDDDYSFTSGTDLTLVTRAYVKSLASGFTGIEGSIPFVQLGGGVLTEDNSFFYRNPTTKEVNIGQSTESSTTSVLSMTNPFRNLWDFKANGEVYFANKKVFQNTTAYPNRITKFFVAGGESASSSEITSAAIQMISISNGQSNTGGRDLNLFGSKGTGTGEGGSISFATARPSTSSGTTQNNLATVGEFTANSTYGQSFRLATTKGAFIANQMSTSQRDTDYASEGFDPVNGMMFYNLTDNKFEFRENGAWVRIGSISNLGDISDVSVTGVTNGEVLTYNSGTGNWEASAAGGFTGTQGSIPFVGVGGGLIEENTSLFFDNANNRLGVNTTSPTKALHVVGEILASANITAFSDIRLKEEIETISNPLDIVKSMRGVRYKRKDSGDRQIGFIAQELQGLLDEVVSDGEFLSVAYGNITAVNTEAIKELNEKVDIIKEKLDNFINEES